MRQAGILDVHEPGGRGPVYRAVPRAGRRNWICIIRGWNSRDSQTIRWTPRWGILATNIPGITRRPGYCGRSAIREYLRVFRSIATRGRRDRAECAARSGGGCSVYFTECTGGTYGPYFGQNLVNDAEGQVIDVLRNWGKSVVFWNLALDQNNGPTLQNGCNDPPW